MKQENDLETQPDKQQIKQRKVSRFGRFASAALQLAVVVGVVGLLVVNRPNPDRNENAFQLDKSAVVYAQPATLDQISSADFASRIALSADWIVADNVKNHADSLRASTVFASEEATALDKPQIVATNLKTAEDIAEYVVKEGESVNDIAKRFNVSADTIKWENGLYSNSVGAGKKLKILPVSGVSHKVSEDDTIKAIVKNIKATKARW